MGQGNLHRAKVNKNDEFYTRYEDVYNELEHYKGGFKDKGVFSNCDDYRLSNFCKFFIDHFKDYGLKRYTAVCYDNGDGAVLYDYDGMNISILPLDGNGDFRSPESIELLKQADVVVTNPPFSLFREYIAQLMEYDKKFLVIGSGNAVTYKEIFPLIKNNKIWLGYNAVKEFKQPDGSMKKFGNICGYTNIPTTKRSEKLILGKRYKPEEYDIYENYPALNVDKVLDIPVDWDGLIGVPITFLDKYCPDQFEIVSASDFCQEDIPGGKGVTEEFYDLYYKQGNKGSIHIGGPLPYFIRNGKAIIPYKRIFIKKR